MKQMSYKYTHKPSSLFNLNASRQATIGILLLTIIPSMICFLAGSCLAGGEKSSAYAALLGLIATALAAVGYRIYRKFPDNITELRHYVAKLKKGKLPHHMTLKKTDESNDLLYIEQSFNALVEEMKKQEDTLVKKEHHRTVLSSVAILVDRLKKPTEQLQKNLVHLSMIAPMKEEHADISTCLAEIEHIKQSLDETTNSKVSS